ncbi:endonuclease domain-containing protein [Ciceribacter selenitireducens]|uniref:DUF559 domain-containing protein n=1 Tax=Ciceribacter selenitireducens ATCC BAA-1503 TaxID=1336235 RepID=A0A376AL41_9HYPH|nr:DUF559 domain-containing protein [Ciceribacter selenitireducens]SSC68521.1 unnamed protein product [Ciceribacter selenitireducens ATCC BAA-1503]
MRGPDKQATARARSLRQVDNDAEARLWSELRNRRLNGFKFVRQLAIVPYFADFACRERMLVVEVDGSQHAGSPYDRRRDDFMRSEGWAIVRIWNMDVLNDMPAVLETLVAILEGRLTETVDCRDLRYFPAGSGQ